MALTEAVMPKRERKAGLASWVPLLGFGFMVAMGLWPILAHTYLPLIDLPNHIARHHIAAHGDGPLAQYYTYTFSLVPNSAVDLLWRFTGQAGDPVLFSNRIMALYAVLFVSATMILARVLWGRWTGWSAVVGIVTFSGPFFWGFQNFIFSVPFCLLGLALWLLLEDRKRARLLVFFAFAAMLYLMHFFAFAILCIAVFGREAQVQLEDKGPLSRRFGLLVLNMLPFAVPVFWLALNILTGPETPAGTRTEFGELINRFGAVTSPFMAWNTESMPQINLIGYLAAGFLALCFATLFWKRGPHLVLHRKLRGAVVVLTLATLLAPIWLNGVALVHIRVPLVLLAVLFAATCWQGLNQRQLVVLSLIVAMLVGARSFYVERFIARYDHDIRTLLDMAEVLPAGARVLPVRGPGLQEDYRLSHAQAYLVAKRDVFVPTLFQGVHAIQVNPDWSEYAHPALFAVDLRLVLRQETNPIPEDVPFLEDWEQKFTHVLLLDRDTNDIHTDPRLSQIAQAGRFTLYRVE